MIFQRFENLCDCGRKKVAGAITCSTCYQEARDRREQPDSRARMIRQAGLEAVAKALEGTDAKV